MNIIICLDDNNGMMFNHRRVSRDAVVISDVVNMMKNRPLWMKEYSQELFEGYKGAQIHISNGNDMKAGEDDYYFVEDFDPAVFKGMKRVIVYRWNRQYPSDTKCTLQFDEERWKHIFTEEFKGYSHQLITKDIYEIQC